MELQVEERELRLKHAWTLSRGSSTTKRYAYVTLTHEGISGLGEAAHNARYGESLDQVQAVLQGVGERLAPADPWKWQPLLADLGAIGGPCRSALAAVDLALFDWIGRRLGIPLHRFFGLEPDALPLTSVSIGIGDRDEVVRKVLEAEPHPILKIKLGGGNDEEVMEAVRSVSTKTVRVDANEGWKTPELALEKIRWLAGLGVELVEQPLPAGQLDGMRWLKERSPLPLVADEDVHTASDLPGLVGAFHGINLKLMKAGGILEAIRTIHTARALGLRIMIGCMIESSLGITAAAQLGAMADWLDLDGNLLIQNDPFVGAVTEQGKILLPDQPGLGVSLR
ncbi:MAG: L-alanine-DL-glutamate epimerase [Verrucomicrobia bacterium]|nr:MAG: L-alanine-DL-glutamate epimerase [Verrucomicrobiota bacterium]